MERRMVESTLFAFLLGPFDSSSSSSSSSSSFSWSGTKALSSLSWFYPCVPKRPNNRDTHFFPSPRSPLSREFDCFPRHSSFSIFDPSIRANNSREENSSALPKLLNSSLSTSLFSFFFNHVSKIWNLNGEREKKKSGKKWNKNWARNDFCFLLLVYVGRMKRICSGK